VSDLDRTLTAIRHHNWFVVLLRPRSKEPSCPEGRRIITTHPGACAMHFRQGGNLALECGTGSRVAVIDFDDLDAARDMFATLGPLVVTVSTGSGKWHAYVRHEEFLPAKLTWHGRRVGDVQRGPNQYVVMPPSVHPETREPYTWHTDPLAEIPALPDAWREHLCQSPQKILGFPRADIPDYLYDLIGDHRGVVAAEPWTGPPAEELIRRALTQPGARRRTNCIKFACAGCVAEGHDKHRDNAAVFLDGRWGCALDPAHKEAIGVALGVIAERHTVNVPGYDSRTLRRLGFGL
jgi:hypothetical protein